MNELKVFNNVMFGNVRIILRDNEPWFVAKDVCDCLDIGNSRQALSRLDDDEKNSVILNDGIAGNPTKAIVNEYGLYSLVMSSRKPEAKEFKRWVTHEVLPSIRKYGTYSVDIPRTLPDALKAYASEIEAHNKTKALVEEQKPKVLFADAVNASHTSILVGDLAKLLRQNGLDIGQNRLFERLRQEGYLIKQKGESYNMPTQRSMDMKLFEVKESTFTNPDGSTHITKTSKVTGKGQIYFTNRYLSEVQ
ncbi:MAG: phage antirepressor KilAC domain-containing protein [Solobacterium sp.]|nr:phage antirepressor KilAC domain-containing protein [Solobacterium sp.]